MKMRSKQKMFVLCAAVFMLSVSVFAAAPKKAKQKTDILDDKGAALGIPTPEWVLLSVGNSSIAVEALDEYKDQYAFIPTQEGQDKAFLLAWVGRVRGPQEIARFISETVETNLQTKMSGKEGDGVKRNFTDNMETLSNSSYTGVRKVADWWVLARNKKTKKENYQAFVLYIADKQAMNDQIAANLQNIVDNNKAMSAAERAIYADIMNDIRKNGLFK
ncbi:MAG: hypothetical protein Ta2A_25790 [Treponemataceae bacterium]|nr:MAG: hypothetical protein Ta2A_25790 [Treponemataceae bacterium]